MDPSGTAALYTALRASGLYAPAVLKRLPEPPPDNSVGLADTLAALGVLTPYQARKLRIGRLADVLIGQYLVLDKVGEGGMGKVYKAVQLRTGRIVALKVVRSQLLSNPVIMRRYQREAAAAAALAHPNIVGLYDADEAGGKHFMAMEFVDGSDLARLVKTFGPLDFAEGCEYIRQAALGLQHAHDAGLVHRDIKPSNLLVCGERAIPGTGGVAVVKVLDMGLVRNLADDGEQSEVTRDGTVVGTPDYMAPEQAKNSSAVGPAADLYSLGCTLYFLFTGRPPFPTGTPIEKLLQHQIDKPPDPRKFRPDMPYALVDLILKLLAKAPGDRVPSAAVLAERLAPFANGKPDDFGITDLRLPPREAPEPVPPPTPGVEVPGGSTQILTKSAPVATLPAPPVRKPRPVPAPQAAARAETEPEAEDGSLPDAPTPPPVGVGVESDGEILDAETVRYVRPSSAAKRRRGTPAYVWALCGAGGLLVLAVIAGTFGGRKPSPAPAPEPPPQQAAKPPTPAAIVGPIPFENLLPNRAAAAAVVYPAAYLSAFKTDIRDGSRLAAALARLDRNFAIPVEKVERLTVGFPADLGVVASAEGPFVTPTLADEQTRIPAATTTKIAGFKLTAFPTGWKNYYGGVAGGRAAVVGTPAEAVGGVVARAAGKPAQDLPQVVLAAGAPHPPNSPRPFLTFVADGRYTVPGLGTLSDLKLKSLTAKFRANGRKIDGDFELTASTREQLQDFVSLTVFGKFSDTYPAVKPILDPFRDDALRNYEDGPGGVTLRLHASWDIADVHLWIEDFLPKP